MLEIKEISTSEFDPGERHRDPRIYFHIESETVMQNFLKRAAGLRPTGSDYENLLPEILRRLELNPEHEAEWSQYAGCTCPCSPGFILRSPSFHQDIHVTVGPKE